MRNRLSKTWWSMGLVLAAGLISLPPAACAASTEKYFSFNGTNGQNSYGGLVTDSAGNFYGNTCSGGPTVSHGVIFKVGHTASGKYTYSIIFAFDDTDGSCPMGQMVFDSAGNLYGATETGGPPSACNYANGCGVVFRLTPTAKGMWKGKLLYAFQGGTSDGGGPYGGVALDSAGNVYGTLSSGGDVTDCESVGGCGAVFELTPTKSGQWKETILHFFTNYTNGGDGAEPEGRLIFDKKGNFYGTTYSGGGADALGTVFEFSPAGGGAYNYQQLYAFTGCNTSTGCQPVAGVTPDAQGNLYGTVSSGEVYELTAPNWGYSVLLAFNGLTDGEQPFAPVVFDKNGNLFGTTWSGPGNVHGGGTIYELSPSNGGWTETVIHSFLPGTKGNFPQGEAIYAPVLLDSKGNLYGSTTGGGAVGDGVIFKVTP